VNEKNEFLETILSAPPTSVVTNVVPVGLFWQQHKQDQYLHIGDYLYFLLIT